MSDGSNSSEIGWQVPDALCMIHEFAVELLLNELSTFITNRLEALEEETSPKIRGRTLAFRAQLTNIYATLVERFSFDSFDESARTRSAE